jgi:halocyanin-like protein
MTSKQSIGRRTFLRGAGGIAIASVIAGCMTGSSGSSSSGNEPSSVDDWLSETKNYDGTTKDRTGTKSVMVEVGPKGNEYVFAPAAIKISPGTTVTWKWIGDGTHNVVASDEQFNSGSPESGATFEHTFETSGTFYYYCAPHKSMGMKGAVIVADSSDASDSNNTDA